MSVDPSIIYSPQSPTDSFVDSICTTCNYNGLTFLKAGWSGNAQYYSYIRFPDLTPILGKGVTNAQLRVEATYKDDPSNYGLTALRTHGTWNASTITWANMASHGPESYHVDSTGYPDYYFDITTWAQGWSQGQDGEWINGKWSPYGATINTAGNSAFYQLGAAESTFMPNIPQLSVTYTNQTPNVPPTASLSPVDGWVGTSDPTLSAGFSDNDDPNGTLQFEVAGVTTDVPTSGGVASFRPQVGTGIYSWRVRGKDVDSAGPWTAYRTFTINSPLVFADDFSGANGSSWNTTKWRTTSSDSTRIADLQGNQGRLGAITSSSRATADLPPMVDSDVTLTYRFGDRNLRSFLRLMLRGSGATGAGQMPNGYRVELRTDSGTIKLASYVNSVATPITSFAYTKDTNPQKLRLQVQGTCVRIKAWPAGAAEPGTWQIEVSDSSIPAAGSFQINHNFDTGVHDAYIDDVRISTVNSTSFAVAVADPVAVQAVPVSSGTDDHCDMDLRGQIIGERRPDGKVIGTWEFSASTKCDVTKPSWDSLSLTSSLSHDGSPQIQHSYSF